MRSIGDFFSRIQNRHTQELFLRKIAQDCILKVAKIAVLPENVSFKGRTLTIKGLNQTEKSEVYMKKLSIIAEITKSNIPTKVEDIRY